MNKVIDSHIHKSVKEYDDSAFIEILDMFHDEIREAQYHVRLTNHKSLLKPVAQKPKLLFDNRFISKEIRNYIEEFILYERVFTTFVSHRKVTIHIAIFDEMEIEPCEVYVNYMLTWLNICIPYANDNCSKTLDIYFYPTKFNKQLPSEKNITLGPEHVNSAVTWRCSRDGEIVIYREEEWLKVFIHETIHSFGLDIDVHIVNYLKPKIKKMFPIESTFEIGEAYAETWARIMNACIIHYKEDKLEFIQEASYCLEAERKYSIIQMELV